MAGALSRTSKPARGWVPSSLAMGFTIGFAEAAAVLGLRELTGSSAAFSLADTGQVGALLSGAGFGSIEFAKADEPHGEWPAGRHRGVTHQALLLDVKEALVDEFVDAEGA